MNHIEIQTYIKKDIDTTLLSTEYPRGKFRSIFFMELLLKALSITSKWAPRDLQSSTASIAVFLRPMNLWQYLLEISFSKSCGHANPEVEKF